MGVKPYYEHIRNDIINKELKEIDIINIIEHYEAIRKKYKSSNKDHNFVVVPKVEIDFIKVDGKK